MLFLNILFLNNIELNIKAYIESGILELYAMGTLSETEHAEVLHNLELYAELREELECIEKALENYALQNNITSSPKLKAKLLDSISNLENEKEISLSNLPIINKYSDYKNWLKLIKSFGDLPLDNDGRHITMLRHNEEITQMLIVSTTDIEEETHLIEHESFLILEGECRCTVGDHVRMMSAGDFMQIPLFEAHDVQLVSPKVTAILQRVRI
jgi:mannose-6-phosphate isomerase-like protein (cupin superfamily)